MPRRQLHPHARCDGERCEYLTPLPELARFLGIVIGMFYREHGVPHIHAVYGEHEISVEVGAAQPDESNHGLEVRCETRAAT